MKTTRVTAGVMLAVAVTVPPIASASSFATRAQQPEHEARWGLLGTAINSYEAMLDDPQFAAEQPRIHLALAKLHMDRQDYLAAERELQRAQKLSPDSDPAAKLLRKLQSKRKLHMFTGQLQFAVLHDTDTANASASSPATPPSFTEGEDEADEEGWDDDDLAFEDDALDDLLEDVDLDEDDLEEEGAEGEEEDPVTAPKPTVHDNRLQAGLALRYSYGLNDSGDRWNLAANYSQANQDEQTKLDRQSWALSTGPLLLLPSLGLKLNPSVTYLQLYKDYQYELSSTVLSLAASHRVNRTLELSARYNYENRDFNSAEVSGLDVDTLKLTARFKPTGKDSLELSVSPKVEDNAQHKKDKNQNGWKLAYARKLPWNSFATLAYSRRHSDFIHDPKGKEEDENKYSLGLGHALGKNLRLSISYEHMEKASNQPGKDKNNESTALSIGYRF